MKRRTLSLVASLSLLLTSSNFVFSIPASAASVGSGNCVQTVDDSNGVAVYEASGSCYIAFKSIGTRVWTVPANAIGIDYLIVAGGGSGGSRHAGGGGAGGMLTGTRGSLTGITALSLSVGGGGSAVVPSSNNYATGLQGTNSSLAKSSGSGALTTLTAIGGGGGEAGGVGAQSGGSGGGAQSASVSSATAGQGNSGGTGGSGSGYWWAGGGGGAGGAGGNGSLSAGGAGGTGAVWLASFTTTVATGLGLIQTGQTSGTQVYFAGGGGGSTTSTSAGGGGLGGGGAAVTGNSTGTSGTTNSGGGGGGSGCCNGGTSGAGGSGVIIIRYTIQDIVAPTFSSSASFTASENIATSATAATISVSESSTITISSGSDAARFNIYFSDSTTALVKFKVSPDYESPTDTGGNNVYELTLTATDPAANAGTQAITITVTDIVDTSSFTSFILNGSVTTAGYRTAIAIKAYVTVASKVTFKANNVRIPGCINVRTSGSSPNILATCSWKASRRGNITLTATANPTGAGISSSSATPLKVFVTKRSGTR